MDIWNKIVALPTFYMLHRSFYISFFHIFSVAKLHENNRQGIFPLRIYTCKQLMSAYLVDNLVILKCDSYIPVPLLCCQGRNVPPRGLPTGRRPLFRLSFEDVTREIAVELIRRQLITWPYPRKNIPTNLPDIFELPHYRAILEHIAGTMTST